MYTVIISGSRSIKHLPAAATQSIDKMIEAEAEILVGDAHGVDAIVQRYLMSAGYSKVVVCFRGEKPRNNLGFESIGGFRSYQERDRYMCDRANFGLAIWDGISPGTRANINRVKTKIIQVTTEKIVRTYGDK